MTALLIVEAIDTAITIAHALLWWWIGIAIALTLLVLAIAAAINTAWNAARRRLARPSWAHSRRSARDYARTRTRRPSEPTEPHIYREAA